jgi:hypothetical protein
MHSLSLRSEKAASKPCPCVPPSHSGSPHAYQYNIIPFSSSSSKKYLAIAVAAVVPYFPLQHGCQYYHLAKVSMRQQSLDITRICFIILSFNIFHNMFFFCRGESYVKLKDTKTPTYAMLRCELWVILFTYCLIIWMNCCRLETYHAIISIYMDELL